MLLSMMQMNETSIIQEEEEEGEECIPHHYKQVYKQVYREYPLTSFQEMQFPIFCREMDNIRHLYHVTDYYDHRHENKEEAMKSDLFNVWKDTIGVVQPDSESYERIKEKLYNYMCTLG
jgi:hypothetical protein